MSIINPGRLVLARESRGILQSELNEKLGLAVTTLSKVERGELGLSADALTRLAAITSYPLSFFSQPGSYVPDYLTWRRREKVKQRQIAQISAQINILRFVVQELTRTLNIVAPVFPAMRLTEEFTPAHVARHLRQNWSLPEDPIINLTELLETNGIPVVNFNYGTDRVDSRSTITDDRYPFISLNSNHTADRQRFSLAYQLGHLLMHVYGTVAPDQDLSHEANLFAAELLMPEAAIRADFNDQQISFPFLKTMKSKWRVSMISLLYRADDLGYLTENQKRYLIQQFNELKLRRREPVELDIPVEQPKLIRTWLASLKRREKLTTATLAARLHLGTDDFITFFN